MMIFVLDAHGFSQIWLKYYLFWLKPTQTILFHDLKVVAIFQKFAPWHYNLAFETENNSTRDKMLISRCYTFGAPKLGIMNQPDS